jgi:hypothetical protein
MRPLARKLLLLGVAFPGSIPASNTWYVDVNGVPPGTGTLQDPYTSIQYAVDQPGTQSGDSLSVAPGVYLESISFRGKTLAIESSAGAAATTLDALGTGSVVVFEGGEGSGTRLLGFTLRGGTGTASGMGLRGGALHASNATARIEACLIEDCTAEAGGAAYLELSDVEIVGCTIQDITCGGGIYADSMLRLGLYDCTLTHIEPTACSSSGGELGALCVDLSTVVLTACTFEENKANFFEVDPDHASGVELFQCASTIIGCTFLRHGVDEDFPFDIGGAIAVQGGTIDVQTCSFVDNDNETRGGAIAIRGATATIADTSFDDNSSADEYWGGAIYVSPLGGSDLVVERSAFRANSAGDGGAVYVGAGTATFSECTFEDNEVSAFYYEAGAGGAVFVDPAALVAFSHCTFSGNRALGNCCLNPTSGRGGAVHGPASLDRCTLVANLALGGSMPAEGGAVFDGALTSSIAWNNMPDQLAGTTTASYCDVQGGFTGTGNLDADPRFWDEGGRDWHLLPSSPCIDAGDPFATPDEDSSRADMGAFAFDASYCAPPRTYCTAKTNSLGCVPAIGSTGTPAASGADDFHIVATQVLNHQNGILIWSRGEQALPFFGGTLCLDAPIKRTPIQNSGGSTSGSDCSGTFDFHFSHEYMAFKGVVAYDALYAQFWYRDPMDATGIGLTDALRFVICATSGD